MGIEGNRNVNAIILVLLAGAFTMMIIIVLAPFLVFADMEDPATAADDCEARQPGTSKAAHDIPAKYLALYKKAGTEYGLPWSLLAGIGKVESSHGQSKLPGVSNGENYAGAGGPMQFLRSTWRTYGVDGDDDGKKDRYNPADAIPGAAKYLRASGAPENTRKAVFAYNHSNDYVDLVLSWAKKYAQKGEDSESTDKSCASSTSNAAETSPPSATKHRRSPRTGVSGCAQVTRTMIDEIDTLFGPFPAIGCARPGDPQDHGTGHAADFMVSSGGRMPSTSGESLGSRMTAYSLANYKRLRIKYVIWQQRIWNPSICKCWRHMSDRGSITQNHFDHVHISVLKG